MPLPRLTPYRPPEVPETLDLKGNFIWFRNRRVGHLTMVPPRRESARQWYATANDGRRTENMTDKISVLILFAASQFLEPMI